MTNDVFYKHFRMNIDTFKKIEDYCCTHYSEEQHAGDAILCKMSVKEMALITIFYLATQATAREISLLFERCQSSVWNAVKRITGLLEERQSDWVQWPTNGSALRISNNYASIAGFPAVLGTIDGCHIAIDTPAENSRDYINRKMFSSIVLLAVALPNLSFSYVFAGFPGSAHDARVFKNSDLAARMNTNPALLFPNQDYHLLGDAAFENSNFVVPAFKDTFADTREKRKFNKIHSKTRTVVEHAFGRLKNKWRRLQHIKTEVPNAVRITVASCVLHNFVIFCEEPIANCEYGDIQTGFNLVPDTDKRHALVIYLDRQ